MLHFQKRSGIGIFAWVLAGILNVTPSQAQSETQKKRATIANVSRIVVTSPYIGTSEYLDNLPLKSPGPKITPEEAKRQSDERRKFLADIEQGVREVLAKRLKVRTKFTLIDVEPSLPKLPAANMPPTGNDRKADEETPSLFKNSGRMKGSKFPLPDPVEVRKLAKENNADAVLMAIMDEPRRDGGGYFFDFGGPGYRSPHVSGKMAFYLYTAAGDDVMKEYVEVLHPLTRIGSKEYTKVDMAETHEQIIENFLDELTRYLP